MDYTDDQILGIVKDPRWQDKETRKVIASKMPPELLKRVLTVDRQSMIDTMAKDYMEKSLPLMVGAGATGRLAQGVAGALSKIPIQEGMKRGWNALGGPVIQSIATATGHPWLGIALGHGADRLKFNTKGPAAPPPAPTPKPWGQRSAPVAGSKPLGPARSKADTGTQHGPANPMADVRLKPRQGGPPGPPNSPPDPPNLIRQGNVTNPGPGGPGSPSVNPKKPVERRSVERTSKEDEFLTQARQLGISEERFKELLKIFGGQPGARQAPLKTMDEADVRKILFGGAGGNMPGQYVRPQDRTPVGRRKPK